MTGKILTGLHTSKYVDLSTLSQRASNFRYLKCLIESPFIAIIPEPQIYMIEFITFSWISLLAVITLNSFVFAQRSNFSQMVNNILFFEFIKDVTFWLPVIVTNLRMLSQASHLPFAAFLRACFLDLSHRHSAFTSSRLMSFMPQALAICLLHLSRRLETLILL